MALNNAQRQAKYRKNISKTHRKIEVVLECDVYDHLQALVKASGESRQDFMTGLIHSLPLPVTETVINDAPQQAHDLDPLPVVDARIQPTREPKKLWMGVSRCQSSTKSGKPFIRPIFDCYPVMVKHPCFCPSKQARPWACPTGKIAKRRYFFVMVLFLKFKNKASASNPVLPRRDGLLKPNVRKLLTML